MRAGLAALRNAEDIQPTPGRPLLVGDPIRRRRLAVIDLDSGAVADPLPDEDLAMYLISWSPDSSRLLAFGFIAPLYRTATVDHWSAG